MFLALLYTYTVTHGFVHMVSSFKNSLSVSDVSIVCDFLFVRENCTNYIVFCE